MEGLFQRYYESEEIINKRIDLFFVCKQEYKLKRIDIKDQCQPYSDDKFIEEF